MERHTVLDTATLSFNDGGAEDTHWVFPHKLLHQCRIFRRPDGGAVSALVGYQPFFNPSFENKKEAQLASRKIGRRQI